MTKFKYINQVVELFEQYSAVFGEQEIVGCTEEEVEALESLLPNSYRLPEAYREFLFYCGRKMGVVSDITNFSYKTAYFNAKDRNQEIMKILRMWNKHTKIPEDMFIVSKHITSYFDYVLLSEGDNPPVYAWNEEDEDEDEDEDEGKGLEVAYKRDNSICDFFIDLIGASATYSLRRLMSQKLKQNQPLRGKQFWIPTLTQLTDGIDTKTLAEHLGFFFYNRLKKVAALCEIEPISYLEELSGWKAIKVGDEVRFFPPSYESPEEKEKKESEQQNQLESRKLELAKIEKRITNFQDRIKNLSSSKLTGSLQFNDISTSKIKELEKELRQQKVLKQNKERQIAELEKE